MENLVDLYLSKLKSTDNAGKTLYNFFRALFNTKWDLSAQKQFHKLVRVYGRYRVFFALVSVYDSYHDKDFRDKSKPYPLIAYFIKKDLKLEYEKQLEESRENLKRYMKEYEEYLDRKEEVKVADTFEENNDGNEKRGTET